MVHSFEAKNIPVVSVPPPDLSRFNRLLGGGVAAERPGAGGDGGAATIET
jgi:hypothetical protein